jgi:uncharacterized phiE125 gp8 family phage protein
MGLTQTAAPSGTPVDPEEYKAHARIDDGAEDTARLLLASATETVEDLTARQFINATWAYTFRAFPTGIDGTIWLPKAPVVSITSITYLDTDGNSQTVSTDTYQAIITEAPGRVVLQYGESWPTARIDTEAVTVTFVAGYGTVPAQVPRTAKHCILALASHWWWNTGSVEVPESVMSGIRQLRVHPREGVLNG